MRNLPLPPPVAGADSLAIGLTLACLGSAATIYLLIAKILPSYSWEGSGGADAIRELDERRERNGQPSLS